MSTQTSSPNKTTPTEQRDPLRWLIPAALLLLFLSICCIGQVVITVLWPRNAVSNLNLLSKDMADYSPWRLQIQLPPIAQAAAAAEASDRATANALATLSPTSAVVANIPTEEVIVIAAPENAPTNTPGSALVTPQPTVTPRPAGAGPTDTPVIGTLEPGETTIAALPGTPTNTPRTVPSDTAVAGSQPTSTNTPAPPTVTNTARADTPVPDTATPTDRPAVTKTSVPPTNTPASPEPATPEPDTPVPPTQAPTPVQPTATDVPPPPPTKTNTPVPPPPTKTNTPAPPTITNTSAPATATNTSAPPTVTNTATITPVTPSSTPTNTPTATNTPTNTPTSSPTNTPTSTPTPTCAPVAGTLTIIKIASNYTPGVGQQFSYTICIFNATGGQILLRDVQDTLPNQWFWGSPSCDFNAIPARTDLGCTQTGSINGGPPITWSNPTLGLPVTLNPGDQINLIVNGSYQGAGVTAGQQWCNSGASDFVVTRFDGSTVPTTAQACVILQ